MRYLLAAFPLVGVVIALLEGLWWLLVDACALSSFARAVGLALIPLAVTGGIHMDGFCDVVDALSSHAQPERKRAIMKDPHVGAFAVVGVTALLLAQVAVLSELDGGLRTLLFVMMVPVASRALAGLAMLRLPLSSGTGMGATFQRASAKGPSTAVLSLACAACVACALAVDVLAGVCLAAGALASFAWFARMARHQFGGMSGDLAGFFLQVLELVLPACILVAQKAVGL